MRDFLVVVIVFGSIPFILVRPQIGVLMWYWISLMNPHRWTWGYAYTLRVALVIGVSAILGWLFSRERKMPPFTATVFFLACLTLWITVSTVFSLVPASAWPRWEEAIKTLAMTFIAICILNSKERIVQCVWIIAVSIGAYGVKGGLFSIATAGQYHVWGPDETFIADNNQLGLALIMIMPLLYFLLSQVTVRWMRLGLLGALGLTLIATLCTYSRGAFLALAITLFAFWLKAKRRMLTGVIAVVALGGALMFLPSAWYDRMYSIDNYEQDELAQGRINSWMFALRLAADHPLTGGGFRVVDDSALYFRYIPTADVVHNFHSIYFEILGEHGWVGLLIFLGLILSAFLTAQSIIRRARGNPELEWAGLLAMALQVAFVGYCSAGAFVNLGFYDLFYALVAVLTALKVVVDGAVVARPETAAFRPLGRAQPQPQPQGAMASRL